MITKMKTAKYILVSMLMLLALVSRAQQDPMFTQYMTNPLTVNPAIAGARAVKNFSLVFREQWMGIEGAPTTIALSYSELYKDKKVGLGANLIHDRIGPVVQTGLYLDYAYHLDMDEQKKLSLGLMGGFNYYQFNLLGLTSAGPDDDIPLGAEMSRFLPNFGFGAYYYTPKFFAGLSVPKLLRNSLSDEENSLTLEDREERHLFAMTGYTFILDEKIWFKPSAIGRIVNGAPASLDLNATFVLNEKVWLGALYRWGVGWGGLVRWQIDDQLHIGYSYDGGARRLRGYHYGSHEIFISFDLKKPQGTKTPKSFY
jgi:type IX secretion system PorP/SprF family membrane protein